MLQTTTGGARELNARIREGRCLTNGAVNGISESESVAQNAGGGPFSAEPTAANARHCAHCISAGSCFSWERLEEVSDEKCDIACAAPSCCASSRKNANATCARNRRGFTETLYGSR